MNYKEKPFRKPRQTGSNTDKTHETGHRKDYSQRFKDMESWMDKHVTGQRKTSTEDTRPPPIQNKVYAQRVKFGLEYDKQLANGHDMRVYENLAIAHDAR
jgi:hypothetical protein